MALLQERNSAIAISFCLPSTTAATAGTSTSAATA